MASNFPGPYEIEISYTVDGDQHKQRLNVDVSGTPAVGADPTTVDLLRRSGLTCTLDVAVTEWIDLLKVRFATTASFDAYILWSYTPLTTDRSYVTSGTIGTAGTAVAASTIAHQETYTFRTFEGGIMRLVMLESTATSLVRIPYASAVTSAKAIFDYVTASTNWVLARDTSYPISSLNLTGGQNEAVFRKRYR